MNFLKRAVLGAMVVGSICAEGKVSVWNLDGNLIGTFTNIQTAIDKCPAGGTVLVTAGTYTEVVYINKNINLIAHEPATISVFDVGSVVVFDGDGADGAIISGFIITGAQEAAIECRNGADPKIINNTILHNWSGILVDSSSPIIANNVILRNESDGIICWDSSTIIINNTIFGNDLDGIYLWNSSATIVNNIIVENGRGSIYSGGINSWDSSLTIDHNCVWGNGTDTTGDGIGDHNYKGCVGGLHDISHNPQFVNIDDFHLKPTSPCIDKGTNTAFMSFKLPLIDKDGNKRIVNNVIDIGAYEFQLQKSALLRKKCFSLH